MGTLKLAITSVLVFLVVVFGMWYSYDTGYKAAQTDHIVDYNDGFIDGQNNNVPHPFSTK
jgi:hydrogenase/urease accessory protein HupE